MNRSKPSLLCFSFYFHGYFTILNQFVIEKKIFSPLQPSKCLIFWRKYFRGNEKWRRTKSQFVGSLFWTHYWQENDKKSISPFMAENSGKMSRKTTFSPRKAKRPRRRPAKKNPDGTERNLRSTRIIYDWVWNRKVKFLERKQQENLSKKSFWNSCFFTN